MSSWPSRPRLFVYGTLRRGFDNRYARLLDHAARYLGTAGVQGRLYDLGRYPGILLHAGPGEWVVGDLFRLHNAAETLDVLDRYEWSAFERVATMALLPNGDRARCWVYEHRLPGPRDRRIVSGDYLEKMGDQ